MSNNSGGGGPREVDEAGEKVQPKCPYAVLAVAPSATLDDIQRSYKHLSRAFHPDKQPDPKRREEAQATFVEFKVAHDILVDPVLRQAYDDHGHYGVYFVKRSMNSSDPNSTFRQLVRLHKVGKRKEAMQVLDEAIQFNEYQHMSSEIDASGSIELRCSMLHTAFLNEGAEPLGLPEVEKAAMNFSVGTVQSDDCKWSTTFGGSTHMKNGQAGGSGSVSVGYTPVQGTDISFDAEVGEDAKVSLSSTRVLLSQTLVTTSVSTLPGSDKLALSLSSHRPLFRSKVRGTWAVGCSSPDFSLHYGLLQFTSLQTKPRYTAKLNIGIDNFPLRLSADHDFSKTHSGQLSYGWGPKGVELSGIMTRVLSKYSKFSVGIKHVAAKGLTWLLRIQRGQMTFSIPISISSMTSPGYHFKCMYMTFLSLLIDEAIGDFVSEMTSSFIVEDDDDTKDNKDALRREEAHLAEMNKARADAHQQVALMKGPAEMKREAEEKKDGLVVLRAIYEVEGGESLDVSNQLQFWVANSRLVLPATAFSNLLGFYDIRQSVPESKEDANASSGWRRAVSKFTFGLFDCPSDIRREPVPTLTVRYKYSGSVYEIRVADEDPLSLPSPLALKLGDGRYVK